jgi:hypothetical protein
MNILTQATWNQSTKKGRRTSLRIFRQNDNKMGERKKGDKTTHSAQQQQTKRQDVEHNYVFHCTSYARHVFLRFSLHCRFFLLSTIFFVCHPGSFECILTSSVFQTFFGLIILLHKMTFLNLGNKNVKRTFLLATQAKGAEEETLTKGSREHNGVA